MALEGDHAASTRAPTKAKERTTGDSEIDARCGVAAVNGVCIAIAPPGRLGRVWKHRATYAVLYGTVFGDFRATIQPCGPFVQGVLRSARCSCGGPAHERNASGSFDQADAAKLAGQSLTLVALKSETIYPAKDYWVGDRLLFYVLPDGNEASTDLNNVDWQRTMDLNAERAG